MVAVGIRCHVVTFNLTARDPEQLAQLARSLDSLDDGRKIARGSVPDCVKDYAAATISCTASIRGDRRFIRGDPGASGRAKDGSVKHVHVIARARRSGAASRKRCASGS